MARTEEEDVNIVEESFVVQEELCQVAQMLAPELLFAPIHLKPVGNSRIVRRYWHNAPAHEAHMLMLSLR